MEMDGSCRVGDWDLTIAQDRTTSTRTLVLVGRTGNGKSATGNSILGRKAFKSRSSSSAVTSTTEMKSTMYGSTVINVIDTPGLFDVHVGIEATSKEIAECIDLARDGVHAVLLVFSVKTRFSTEEESVVESLMSLFGPKITDFLIVVFTGGDELEEKEETIEEYLGPGCPQPLQRVLEACKGRYVLFDNKTKDKGKKAEQLHALLDLVDRVVEANAGRPFSNDIFLKLKEASKLRPQKKKQIDSSQVCTKAELAELMKQTQELHEKQLKQIAETMKSKLIEQRLKSLEQQLAEERAARKKSEKKRKADKQKRKVERLEREVADLRDRKKIDCPIL